ncbi:S8 family serine peptidase [Streptomyces sp. NPDC059629]|uniref:S8 family serine peptidase n=1 Tax=Streptomyces sp. NPDC059629 TaxID=3346889 RepID=UPI00368022A6
MKPTLPIALTALVLAGSSGTAFAAGSAPPPVTQERQAGGCIAASKAVTSSAPWTVTRLDLARTQQLSTGRGITVAVVGSGVERGASKQLDGQVVDAPDIAGHGSAAKDCVGHGTVLAGLIAAKPAAGTGFVGIAPGAKIYSVAVTDSTGATTPDAIAAGIDAAIAAHAQVIDVAVATPTASAQLQTAVHNATKAGSLVVAPATTDKQSQPSQVFPAAYPDVLSVAASGSDGVLPDSEEIGAPVDLTAPGNGVIGVGPGGGEFTGNGPSFATAYAAGAAALVESYQGHLSPAELAHRLEATAVHPGEPVPAPGAGYGELDPYAALTTLLPDASGSSADHSLSAGSGRIAISRPPAPAARNSALGVAAASFALVVLVALAAVIIPRGRRRSWRSGEPVV